MLRSAASSEHYRVDKSSGSNSKTFLIFILFSFGATARAPKTRKLPNRQQRNSRILLIDNIEIPLIDNIIY